MPEQPMGAYQLLAAVIEKGLSVVGSHLERSLRKPVFITDDIGQVHYPDRNPSLCRLDEMFVKLPEACRNAEQYKDAAGTLYLRIEIDRATAYLLIKNCRAGQLAETISQIDRAVFLSIKYYFSDVYKVKNARRNAESELLDHLIHQQGSSSPEWIKLTENTLDTQRPYCVSITEIDGASPEIDIEFFRAYSTACLQKENLTTIALPWPNGLLHIIPARFKTSTLEIDPEWPRLHDSIITKEIVEKDLGITVSKGLGGVCSFQDLHRSLTEARIAVILPRLTGRQSFVQKFDNLGVFRLIFTQDIETVTHYCGRTLEPLIQHDLRNDGTLLPTLRCLLDNSMSWKTTALQLGIHVNTLHHRAYRIEKLLDADISTTHQASSLYTIIKVWDTLKALGYIE